MPLFVNVLLNVVLPLVLAGVLGYLVALPDAPLSERAKRVVPWVLWVAAVLWAVVWLVRVLSSSATFR